MDTSEFVTILIPAGPFWGVAGLAVFLALTGVIYFALAQINPTPTRSSYQDFLTYSGLSKIPRPVMAFISIIWLALFFAFLLGVGWAIYSLAGTAISNGSDQPADLRWSLLTLAAMMTGLGAVISFPFTLLRTQFSRRQTEATEQGLITDRINSAVEMLGTERVVKLPGKNAAGDDITIERSDPNMEVRIGAIHALARLARENLGFHVQIMEILCAYIRQNAPASSAEPLHMPQMPANDADNPRQAWADWRDRTPDEDGARTGGLRQALDDLGSRAVARADIQTALEVIGHRTGAQRMREAGWPDPGKDTGFPFDEPFPTAPDYPDAYSAAAHQEWQGALQDFQKKVRQQKKEFAAYQGYRLDLRHSNLQAHDLSNLNLNGARFQGAKLQGADLWRGKMQGADLGRAQMQGADLSQAKMQGADLGEAKMQGAYLGGAKMQGADLGEAKMQGAYLRQAKMQGAYLGEAQMQGAYLRQAKMNKSTDLRAANFSDSALKSVDCQTVPISQEQVNSSFGDGSVILPETLTRPNWPEEELPYEPRSPQTSPFHIEWRRWQELGPDAYTPPAPGTYD